MKKIVVAFDSFKGSISSKQAAEAAEDGICAVMPECEVVSVPIADGGEGTAYAIVAALNGDAERITCKTFGPSLVQIEADYYILRDGTAVIDVAAASGLTIVPEEDKNPMFTSSYGTGVMIKDALDHGCRRIVLGLGGTATNDAAIGILTALGYDFCLSDGTKVRPYGAELDVVDHISAENVDDRLAGCHFVLACDVDNPFCGENGAAYVFAPQKGADRWHVEALDAGLRHFAGVLYAHTGKDITSMPGAGAAGGIAGTLVAMLGAEIHSGIDVVLEAANFEELIADADLIFSGEGAIDDQSAMGKAVGGVVKYAAAKGVPVVAFAGSVSDVERINAIGVKAVFSIQPGPITLEEAMDVAAAMHNLRAVTSQVVKLLM